MSEFTIYTDGSHLKHTSGRLGIGGILLQDGKEVDKFSKEIDINFLKKNYDTCEVSNPTCEMLASLEAIKVFGPKMKPSDTITLKADYMGVKCFNDGTWQAKLPYIYKIREEIRSELVKIGLWKKLKFEWIKGHQTGIIEGSDAYWNSKVDLLAKGQK
jgi:ribonuclease HI